MSAEMPYVRWYGKDWLGDPMLRMVPPEVRGVWIDLLCAMMNATPYGHLAINGTPMNDEQSARMTGLDIATYKGILKQIEDAHISSRTECGMLYSRRLVRDHARFTTASQAGKKGGGNPALQKKKDKKNPESRSQKPEAKGTIKGAFIDTFKGERPRNQIMDALGAIDGNIHELSQAAWKRAGVALKEIKEASPDVTPDQIKQRAENYQTHFSGAALTSTALAKHWAKCAEPNDRQKGNKNAIQTRGKDHREARIASEYPEPERELPIIKPV